MKRLVAILVAGLAFGAWAPAAAHAEAYSIDDPADASGSLTDVRDLTVRHGKTNLRVKMSFTDVRRDSAAGVNVFIDTRPGRRGPELVLGSGLNDGTDYQLTRAKGWRTRGGLVDCDYAAKVRWDKDVLRTRIARACLGDAARVRVSVQMSDQAGGSQPVVDWVPGTRAWSPWLSSGV